MQNRDWHLRSPETEIFNFIVRAHNNSDIAQWRQLSQNFNETAAKSRAAADKADAALQKATGSSRQKAEQTYSAAKRKAETDESSASDQKAALDKREKPLRRKF
jgi:hypothetical protein